MKTHTEPERTTAPAAEAAPPAPVPQGLRLAPPPFQLKASGTATASPAPRPEPGRYFHAHFPIQRQEAPAEAAIGLDPETEAMLAALTGPDLTPPAFEVIAATTQAQNSAGELTDRIAQLWRRQRIQVDAAARMVAEGDPRRGAPHATQSNSALDPEALQPQWVVYIGAWNYRGRSSDLEDVRQHLRRGSPIQQALRGSYDRVINVVNPTADQMGTQIFDAILALHAASSEGQVAELTVYFEGHGGADGIAGVDWSDLTFEDMRTYARLARDFDIHMTYILDTCNIGSMVNFAQAEETSDLAAQLEGQGAAADPALQQHLESIRTLGQQTFLIGRAINLIYSWRGSLGDSRQHDRIRSCYQIITEALQQLRTHLQSDEVYLSGEAIDHIETLIEPLQAVIDGLGDRPRNRGEMNRLRRRIAPLVDFLNDSVNQSLRFLRRRIQAADQPPA
ncbi:MAG: hypothetical protein D6722_29745 [Bacteroidetes bacterium]|nr:MAG: hypothetical protein D6722_29745 [Bacteroidota bacterium]